MATSTATPTLYKTYILPFLVVSLSATFYLYEFCLRVMPSVLSYQIMNDMGIGAAIFGFIGTCFYYGYIPMQIPIGLLCDRFGPKRLLVISALICAISTIIFAHTKIIALSALSRFMIGMASASAFIAPLTLASKWYDKRHFACITGIVQFLGSLGAIVGGAPIALLAVHTSWRSAIVWSGCIGIILAILYIIFIHDQPDDVTHPMPKQVDTQTFSSRLKRVMCKKQNWLTGLAGMCSWAGIAIFAELWGIPFLMDLQHISNTAAANETACIWYGLAFASPLSGWWSDRIQSRTIPLMTFAAIGLISSTLLIYGNITSEIPIYILLFFFGFAAAAQSVTFGLIADNNEEDIIATAIGFNNMMVVSGAFLQTLVGYVIGNMQHANINHSTTIYTAKSFQYGFIVIPCIFLLAIINAKYFLQETHCRKTF